MLTIIVVKFLVKGVIKRLVVQPAVSATISMFPSANLVNFSSMGQNLSLSTTDMIKFGIEKLYERYGEAKIDFRIDRLRDNLYKIVPANDLARIFFKEYADDAELIVDIDRVDEYLDLLYEEDIDAITVEEAELDTVTNKILSDLDLAIELSAPRSLNSAKEALLVDQILEKNRKLIDSSIENLKTRKTGPQSAVEEILIDFPSPPSGDNDEDEIEEILRKLTGESKDKRNSLKI